MNWFTFTSVEDIPAQWDDLVGDNIFLQRIFLKHLEKVNPCISYTLAGWPNPGYLC